MPQTIEQLPEQDFYSTEQLLGVLDITFITLRTWAAAVGVTHIRMAGRGRKTWYSKADAQKLCDYALHPWKYSAPVEKLVET
jgi:hypothetical protein